MRPKSSLFYRGYRRQRGVSLIVSLVFLLILAGLGLAALQTSTLQERMAGTVRDRNLALLAAEVTLRDALRDLSGIKADGVTWCQPGTSPCRSATERPSDPNPVKRKGFWSWGSALRLTWTPDCFHGQCNSGDNPTKMHPVWDDAEADWSETQLVPNTNKTIKYGQYTGATAIDGVIQQPRYILEIFPVNPLDVYGVGPSKTVAFRITVRAWGQSADTMVMLQGFSSASPI